MFPFPNDPKFGNHGLRENDMSLQRCFSYCASNKYVYSGIQVIIPYKIVLRDIVWYIIIVTTNVE